MFSKFFAMIFAVVAFVMMTQINAQGLLGADFTGTGTVLQAHGGELPRMSAFAAPSYNYYQGYDNQAFFG